VTVTDICGVKGNANIGVNFLNSFGYPNEASSCAEGCPLFERVALSFSYNPNSKVCYCYGGTVAEVSHSYTGSELYFYDIGCSSYQPQEWGARELFDILLESLLKFTFLKYMLLKYGGWCLKS
jgi:hypothetical protein